MARPRVEHSYFVSKVGQTWLGFWYTRRPDGSRKKNQRRISSTRDSKGAIVTKTTASSIHAAWVRQNVSAAGVAEIEQPTLQTLWERHISEAREKLAKGELHPKYVGTKTSLWAYLNPLASRIAATITKKDVQGLFDGLVSTKLGTPLSSETKGHLRNLLRPLLMTVGNNAVTEAGLRFAGKSKGETLDVEDVQKIRAELGERDQIIFDVMVNLGLRAGEANKITRRHLTKPGVLDTPGTKTELSDQPIPIPADLDVRLQALAAAAPYDHKLLFEQVSHRTWLEEVLQPAAKRAIDIDKIDMRMLRRTALTLMAGVDEAAASRMARHSDGAMIAKVYNNAPFKRVARAQDAVAAQLKVRKADS